jgi:U3 small nucleolar RNA-associated protein 25
LDGEKGKSYPRDHVKTFSGNSDDNFRFGIKFTRKAWRVVLPPCGEDKLIGCDIIVASPLALRMASDKEGGVDSLSSIEVVVADGLDVMAMQNWEHVQFVFQNMNKIPNNPHGCDFSRVKPWYLDNQAKFLRQSILISRYDTPEFRSLFNKSLLNVQGKIRVERTDFDGVLGHVRKGVKQVFTRLRGEDALEELEIRFKLFTETTLPALMKSAVSSSNTLIVVPSYFDFVRVTGHMRKMDKISFAAISEYSSNQEISAARTGFFKGKKSFLVITERFHFYRRYRLRGAKTIVFYALPEHADFYAEFMASPFLPSATGKQTIDIDEAEVTSRVAYSKFDYLKLERIVGTENAKRMITDDESKFTFV